MFSGLDRFGRTIDHRWQATGSSAIDLDRFKYGYDRNGNPLYRQHYIATDLDELYAYDRLDRLTGMKRGALTASSTALTATPAIEAAWTLDRLGNWSAYQTKVAGTTDLAQTRTANKVNEITALTNTTGPTWANVAYDAAGNLTAGPKGQDETTQLQFFNDGWNRLVRVEDEFDNPVATYAYDGTGRRIRKTFPAGSEFTSEDTYYNAAYQAVEVRHGSSVYEQTVFDIKYIDAIIVRYRDADPNVRGLDETLFFTSDRMFNVTGVWTPSRVAAERYSYTPYGERAVLDATFLGKTGNASTVDQRKGHQGLTLDGETGTYYNQARQLMSEIGSFDRRDPLGATFKEGLHLYQVTGNHPILFADPHGLARCTTERCCRTWQPGWMAGNYADKKACFVATYNRIKTQWVVNQIGALTGSTTIGVGAILGKVRGYTGLILTAGLAAIALNEFVQAYDICNDLYCVKDRKADNAFTGWAPNWSCDPTRCTCFDGYGGELEFASTGDRKSP